MIYDILPVNNYKGNGTSTVFDFDFYIEDESQLKVYLYKEDSSKNLLIYDVDYSIEGVQSPNGGCITFPLEDSGYEILNENQKISLELDIPVSQETEYTNSSLLNLSALEYSFDYLTRLIQILKRKIELCVKVEECSDNSPQELMDSLNNANISANENANIATESKNSAQKYANNALESSLSASSALNEVLEVKDEFIRGNLFKFHLFDTKISDYILDEKESKGWALQGTYVKKENYPDFYSICLAQKEASEEKEVTLGEANLTMFVNPNGHQFYNISDKSIIDTFYETYGIADFYGIDEVNERVFLPRNKFFHQLTDDITKVNELIESGLPNITGVINFHSNNGTGNASGAFSVTSSATAYGGTTNAQNNNKRFDFDASRSSSIYGNSDTVQPPSSLKLLYYCVGNTEVTQAITNVAEVTTSENDTIPLFTGMYFDFKPNNPSWLKAGVQQNSAGIYKTCYDELVKAISGINPYNLKVINKADMISDVDYSEFWIIDQDNLVFRTPLTISLKTYDTVAPVVGNGMALGLTNGVDNFGLTTGVSVNGNTYYAGQSSSAYGQSVGGQGSTEASIDKWSGVTTDPTKSGIEAHLVENTTSQLYFKVANAVQNLELLDAGKVMEGLANVIPDNSSLIANYAMPSDKYIDLTYGGHSSSYVAPSNGYFTLKGYGNTAASIWLQDNFTGMVNFAPMYASSGGQSGVFLPCKKGQIVSAGCYGGTVTLFRFVYAQGSEGEA